MADGSRSSLPDLTVVVVSLLGGRALEACVTAARAQGAQVTVVGPGAGPDKPAGAAKSIPEHRLDGLRAATTPYVALIEDTAAPGPDWCRSAVEALRSGAAAAGGPVAVSRELPARYRALGLCEYAKFRSPVDRPPADLLPGLALAVDRAICLPIAMAHAHGFVEGEVCAQLHAAGRRVAYLAPMEVTYCQPHPSGASLRTRRQHGRLYGGARVAGMSIWRRLPLMLGAVALPAVLTARTLSARRAELGGATIFWVATMHTAWAWGELVGYVTGSIGDSLESWA